jgi:glycosyltransferase involved in cell wall biosynthesis
MKKTISIIIPCYNEALSISTCLQSIVVQSYTDWECIVVDDGSTDSTVKIIESFLRQDERMQLYKQSHFGPAKARNLAASKSQGEILVFIDADMVLHEKYLESLCAPIFQENVVGTFTRSELVANWDNPWARCWNYEYTGDKTKKRLPKNHPNTSKVFRAITKEAFDSVGGFDDVGYNDDWTLSKKLQTPAKAADKAIVYHANPASASEVALQASWMAKRDYKFGIVGSLWALFRANPVFSLLLGLTKAVYFLEPHYVVFKHVYNAGVTIGILMSLKNLPKSR